MEVPMGLEEFTDVSTRLSGAVDQLSAEFDGIFERAEIETLVHESAQQLEGATVASFVPILAHRFARERLRAQALATGKLARSTTEVVFVSITGGVRTRMAASLLERYIDDTAELAEVRRVRDDIDRRGNGLVMTLQAPAAEGAATVGVFEG